MFRFCRVLTPASAAARISSSCSTGLPAPNPIVTTLTNKNSIHVNGSKNDLTLKTASSLGLRSSSALPSLRILSRSRHTASSEVEPSDTIQKTSSSSHSSPFSSNENDLTNNSVSQKSPSTSPSENVTLPQAIPSTAHALPLAGGDTTRELRNKMHYDILQKISKLNLMSCHGKIHGDDIVATENAVFVGVGLQSNWPGLLTALEHDVFGVRRVVVVRDVFDRSSDRQCLRDWFAVIADDIVAMHRDVLKAGVTRRRFVNEYVPKYEGSSHDGESNGVLSSTVETVRNLVSDGGSGQERGSGGYRLVRNDIDMVEYLHSSGWRVLPVDSVQELNELQDGERQIPAQQSTNHVLACAPTAFNFNEGAATDNYFMHASISPMTDATSAPTTKISKQDVLRRQVLTEFANLHAALVDRRDGVGAHVHLFTHEDWHDTPDACFPNNTFSTHTNLETGDACVLVLYPMRDESRRKERRLVQRLLSRGRYTHVYDLTREESCDKPSFLEGTGSLVLDRVNRIAYLALSQRSDLKLAKAWGRVMGYSIVPFTSVDAEGRPIYHTNVMMAVGSRVAVVCSESIADHKERHHVLSLLKDTGHAVVDIDYAQVNKFCGNVIELESFFGEQMLVMSTAAHDAFTEKQRETLLGGVTRLVHADISTIERIGGGGVRCTIAELF